MFYTKVREVKSPVRAHALDAGIDFFVPEDVEPFELSVGQGFKIPSGIKVVVPHGYALIGHNKSGVAISKGLDVSASVTDTGYTGEMHLCLNKVAGEPVVINPGDKIVQMLLVPISLEMPEEVSGDLYDKITGLTERGSGGFGSSGVK